MPGSYVTLILMLLAVGIASAAAVISAMAILLLRPPRMSDGKAVWVLQRLSPADLGFAFEEVSFDIRNQATGGPLRIAGWWIPHPAAAGRCVLLLHGYADAKVGAIAWAKPWHDLEYNILAIDLRAHGQSGGSLSTGGFWERHDLDAVLNLLRIERPFDTSHVVLFGVSLGAAVAVATAVMLDDLFAIVLESPPADYRSAAMTHMDRIGAPGWPFQDVALALAQWLAHCDFAAVRPVDLIAKLSCPTMIIAPDADPLMAAEDRTLMQAALTSRRRAGDLWWSVTAGHMLSMHANPVEYEKQLRRFLDRIASAASISEMGAGRG